MRFFLAQKKLVTFYSYQVSGSQLMNLRVKGIVLCIVTYEMRDGRTRRTSTKSDFWWIQQMMRTQKTPKNH